MAHNEKCGLCGVQLTPENTKPGFGLYLYSILGDPVEIIPGVTNRTVHIKYDLVCKKCGLAATVSNRKGGVNIYDHTGPTMDALTLMT